MASRRARLDSGDLVPGESPTVAFKAREMCQTEGARNETHIVGGTGYTIGRSVARMAIQCRLGLLSERSSRDCPAHRTDSCATGACIGYHSVICHSPDRRIPAGNVSM